jgi:hypothetical protein
MSTSGNTTPMVMSPDSRPCNPTTSRKVAYRDPKALKPFDNNAREHTEAQIGKIAKSIETFGFTNPILIDPEDRILAGHGRVSAAIKLGLPSVPTLLVSGLTEAEARVYVIADNKTHDDSWFSLPTLRAELIDLDTGAIDLTLTGYSQAELSDLLGGSKSPPKEQKEQEKELPVARMGDIWQLGENFLVVGRTSQQDALTILEDADKVLHAWQKLSKTKATLHASASNVADQVITEQQKIGL